MPNAKGGKKFKRGKKNTSFEKKLIYKDPKEDQEYGKVIRAMGNGRFEIQCFDGKTRMGIIAGNMRKRVWINKDDIILFSRWEFTTDDDKCSIVHKYDIDESRKLQKEGEFPDTINLDEENEYGDDDNFQFDYGKSDSDSDDEDDSDDEKKEENNKWWSKSDNKDKNVEDLWGKQDDKPVIHRHHEGLCNTTVIDIDDI